MQTAHDQEVMSSNPGTIYWMDVSDASCYIQENIENKGSRMGHTKKVIKKKTKKTTLTAITAMTTKTYQNQRNIQHLKHNQTQ
jgi:hypothetical protein